MIRADIISGVQGSGKSTLILRLLHTVYADEAIALIENEQGKVRLSRQAVRDARGSAVSRPDIFVTDIPTGSIADIARREAFDRILLEPAGTARLADLLPLVQRLLPDNARIHHVVSVVDACSFARRMLLSKDFLRRSCAAAPWSFYRRQTCCRRKKRNRSNGKSLRLRRTAIYWNRIFPTGTGQLPSLHLWHHIPFPCCPGTTPREMPAPKKDPLLRWILRKCAGKYPGKRRAVIFLRSAGTASATPPAAA